MRLLLGMSGLHLSTDDLMANAPSGPTFVCRLSVDRGVLPNRQLEQQLPSTVRIAYLSGFVDRIKNAGEDCPRWLAGEVLLCTHSE